MDCEREKKMFYKYLMCIHIIFWCFLSFTIFTVSVAYHYAFLSLIDFILIIAIAFILIFVELLIYYYFTNAIVDIRIKGSLIIFVKMKQKEIIVEKSDCIKVVETEGRYVFYLKNGKKLMCQKYYSISKKPIMDFSIINQENFSSAEML